MAQFGLRARRHGHDLRVQSSGDQSVLPPPIAPWTAVAAAAAALTAGAGLLLVLGLATLSWLDVPDISFASVFGLSLELWLLAHGAGAQIGSTMVTIVPLGLTLMIVAIATGASQFAGQQARRAALLSKDDVSSMSLALRVGALFGLTYLGCVMVPSFFVNTGSQSGHAFVRALVIGLGSGLVGAARGVGWHPLEALPEWSRCIPRAVARALGVLTLTGLAVLGWALWRAWPRVLELHHSLDPGSDGTAVLVLGQLLWLPNLVWWAVSWSLGAGISLGAGTVVSPAQNLTGLLPSIPVFGVVPANGPGDQLAFCWLAGGVLAGIIAGFTVAHAHRGRKADVVVLAAGLSGVLSGVVTWIFGVLSRGDLGNARLVGMGPRLTHLAVMACTMMGVSGLICGLVVVARGLSRRSGDSSAGQGEADVDEDAVVADEGDSVDGDDEVTVHLGSVRDPD